MKLKPIMDRIVLLPEKQEEKTSGGIIIASSSHEKPILARVISVGDGTTNDGKQIKMLVNVGDRVIFSKFSGSEVKMENETYVVVRQADILAIVEKE